MKSIILLVAIALSSSLAMAEGGKQRNGTMDVKEIYNDMSESIGFTATVPDDCRVIVSDSDNTIIAYCPPSED